MQEKTFNKFCESLAHTNYVMQWGNSHVWKVATKVFAIGGWNNSDGVLGITFKASPIVYEMLQEREGVRPAPYLASRGMKWLQHYKKPGLTTAELKDYITQSHALAAANLTKKKQRALGFLPSTE